jgi:HAD superfamily hydrolase (TIGR01509 family)
MMTGHNLQQLLHGKQLLIFDFDGTVADTTPLHAAAFSEVLAPLGIKVDYSCIAGLKTLDAIRQCLQGAGRVLDEVALAALVTAKQQSVRQMISHRLQPLPGVDTFLRWARQRYRLAMVTSGSRATVSLALGKLGYSGLFNPLISADDVQHAKPDPEGFLKVLRITGVTAAESLVFEDSAAGFNAAHQAGLEFVDVNHEVWQAHLSEFGVNHGH